ncbi:SMI1/KNR4 family protein [Oxalobacteraceae sp. CFBP 8763]|nr:SMI1/KNR4 family protein [Oxalobacteraceae sp. CFBP 8763]
MTSETDPFRLPTDEEINSAEARLGVVFHADYRAFLKSGGDVANAIFDAAVVLPGSGYCDLFEIAQYAWENAGVPRDLVPFVQDNGDYFCISSAGEVSYWSHNGATSERWPSLSNWFQQVCIERR